MIDFDGFYVGIVIACMCVVSGFAAAALGVLAFYALRWILLQIDVFDFALAFMVGVVAAMALTSCAHVEPVHGPHWWNCKNVVCNQVASRVLGASYDRNRHVCDCYIEDARNLPQWIEVKP